MNNSEAIKDNEHSEPDETSVLAVYLLSLSLLWQSWQFCKLAPISELCCQSENFIICANLVKIKLNAHTNMFTSHLALINVALLAWF